MYHPERVEKYVSLAIPHPFVKLSARLLAAVPRLWFQNAIATPGLGPCLLAKGSQPMARYLLDHYTSDRSALTPRDRELFVAPFRDPARAHAGSALYRHFIVPLVPRIMTGRFRGMWLSTPTLILYGSEDPNMNTTILDGYQGHAYDLTIEEVSGASHLIADERPAVVIDRALEFFSQGSGAL